MENEKSFLGNGRKFIFWKHPWTSSFCPEVVLHSSNFSQRGGRQEIKQQEPNNQPKIDPDPEFRNYFETRDVSEIEPETENAYEKQIQGKTLKLNDTFIKHFPSKIVICWKGWEILNFLKGFKWKIFYGEFYMLIMIWINSTSLPPTSGSSFLVWTSAVSFPYFDLPFSHPHFFTCFPLHCSPEVAAVHLACTLDLSSSLLGDWIFLVQMPVYQLHFVR